jgi:PAS domain S-box-containing protein
MAAQTTGAGSLGEPVEFLSTASPSRDDLRRALWVVSLSSLAFIAALPFARIPLVKVPAFIGVYQSAVIINDAITATLLFALFTLTRSAALLVLVSAYMFTAAIAVIHMLTFPGLFSPTGLLGAQTQSTAWLYMAWHGTFPLAVIAYVFVKRFQITRNWAAEFSDGAAGLSALAVAAGLAMGFTTLTIAGHALLPEILRGGHYTPAFMVVVSTVWILSALALVALWIQRPHATLDLWLMVVMCAWIFDVGLSAVFNAGRFDFGFYGGRAFGLLAASYVLIELLLETSHLYAKTFHASMQRSRDLLKASHEEVAMLREQAQEKNALLASIVSSSDDAIISKTLDGVITSWNGGAERMFGYTTAEAIGRHISLMIPPEKLPEEQEMTEKLMRHEPIEHFETVRMGKNGRHVDISLSISPLVDAQGRIVGGANVARDITAQKESEETLKRYAQALERVNNDLEDFAYIASHDLREPLRGLSRHATFLQEDYAEKVDGTGLKRLERIRYLAQNMEQLINNLLSYSRLGREDMTTRRTDLNEVIREVAALMEMMLEERNAIISIPKPLPEILCDKGQVLHVFLNLISNAVKYNSKDRKTVEVGYIAEIRTEKGLARGVFYVRDNADGIEKQFYEKIFQIFKRLNNEDPQKKGSGVGLTFTRKIIHRHGGQIWLESQPGQGTTFYFTLQQELTREAAA